MTAAGARAVRGGNRRAPREVVDGFLDAFEAGEIERAGEFLHPERFSYRGPIDRFDDAGAFLEDLTKYVQIMRRIERRRVLVDGDEACVFLDILTTIPEIEHTRMAVWCALGEGTIERMEGFLDVRGYAALFPDGFRGAGS